MSNITQEETLIITGYFNDNIKNIKSDDQLENITGKYGLMKRNQRGKRHSQFCSENTMTVANIILAATQHGHPYQVW